MKPPVSTRHIPLINSVVDPTIPAPVPYLTVECYVKWYDLYIVHPDGRAETIHSNPAYAKTFKETESTFTTQTGKSATGDHIWHPGFVELLAEKLGISIDEVALEAIIGRWYQEHLNREPIDL